MGENGHFYLLQRPSHEEIQARLWLMYIDAEQKKEDYKNRLRFKVDDARRKEQDLIVWEDALANREWKLEHTEDNIVSLMRELKLKDIMLLDKTAEVTKYKRQVEDSVHEARADVRRFEEVCRIMFLGVTVFLRTSKLCMAAIRGVSMTGIRFVSVCV